MTFKDWLPHQCRIPRGRFTSDDEFFKNKKIFWKLLSWSVVIVAYSFCLRFSAACDGGYANVILLFFLHADGTLQSLQCTDMPIALAEL